MLEYSLDEPLVFCICSLCCCIVTNYSGADIIFSDLALFVLNLSNSSLWRSAENNQITNQFTHFNNGPLY